MVFGVETAGKKKGRRWIRIGFVEEQRFQFGVKELWRDNKRWGFGESVICAPAPNISWLIERLLLDLIDDGSMDGSIEMND